MMLQADRELPAGTVVRLFGVPIELTAPVVARAAVDNWHLVDARQREYGDELTQASLFVEAGEPALPQAKESR